MPYAEQIGYIQKYTDDQVREGIHQMIVSVKHAFIKTLHSINWLNDKTKSAAIKNIDEIMTYVGAPNVMYDMEKFEFILQYDKVA